MREAREGYWSYTGSYPGNRVLRVTIRYIEDDTMQIFVRFLDELTPNTSAASTPPA